VTGEGTPDLELRIGRQIAVVEVKSESELGLGQLARYRRILAASGYPETRLILLTRYPPIISAGDEEPDQYLRWYQIAEWIDHERQRYPFRAVSSFLVEQFLGLLGVKNMVMGQVSWELAGGVRALSSLTNMLDEAATACGAKARVSGTREWMGVYLDGKRFRAGIYYGEPESLYFETYSVKVLLPAAENLAVGEVYEWESEKGAFGWLRKLNLESEDVHFFARSKASQLQLLEAFLRESLELAKSISSPDSGPIVDETDDAEDTDGRS